MGVAEGVRAGNKVISPQRRDTSSWGKAGDELVRTLRRAYTSKSNEVQRGCSRCTRRGGGRACSNGILDWTALLRVHHPRNR